MKYSKISIKRKEDKFETQIFHTFATKKIEGGLRLQKKFKKNNKTKPLITIITVVKNNSKTLEKCIKSVINQSKVNTEHIIIDGGSSDNTILILKKYSRYIDYWISEKDEGIYDGMNKGLKLALGEYIGILNSDDFYKKDSLNIILKYFKRHKNIDFIFGTVFKEKILSGYWPKKIKWKFNFYSAHSVGFFIKKNSQKKVGLYNNKFKFSADRDLFYRMINKYKMKGIATSKKELIGYFTKGGISESLNFFERLIEETKIRINNKQNIVIVMMLFLIHLTYQIRKIFIKKK
tara:strand:+ start:843 stop:1715 length:873 start_codon:yes stop_codon:yes gene_type:complete